MVNGKKVHTFVQVSLTSKRLPGKALMDIHGKNSIQRLLENLAHSNYIDAVILTFTDKPIDDPLEEWATSNGIPYFRGDYLNVIKRYADALKVYPCDIVVRATGDCPVVSFELADQLIATHEQAGADYSRYDYSKLPIGVASEVFNASALKRLLEYKLDFSYSEYMTYYFTNNPHLFSLQEIAPPIQYNYPDYRLTLDYQEDFEMFHQLFCKLDVLSGMKTLRDVLDIINKNKDIAAANSHLKLKYKTNEKLVDALNKYTRIEV